MLGDLDVGASGILGFEFWEIGAKEPCVVRFLDPPGAVLPVSSRPERPLERTVEDVIELGLEVGGVIDLSAYVHLVIGCYGLRPFSCGCRTNWVTSPVTT